MVIVLVLLMAMVMIVRNILECIGKHSFSYECICYQNILIFFSHTFYLKFLTLERIFLIINNEYKSMIFTILRGLFAYANGKEIFANANARMVHTMHYFSRGRKPEGKLII